MKTTIGWFAAVLFVPLIVTVAIGSNIFAIDLVVANFAISPLLLIGYSVAVGVLIGIAVSLPGKPKTKHVYRIPR